MAGRIRTLKPEILENAKTAGLSDTAFRLFIALILEADDHGCLYGDPRRLKARIWWAADPLISPVDALTELQDAKLVAGYSAKGQEYLEILGWGEHQKVEKPSQRRVPAPAPATSTGGEDPTREESGSEIGDRDRDRDQSRGSREGLERVSRGSRETAKPMVQPRAKSLELLDSRGSREGLGDDSRGSREGLSNKEKFVSPITGQFDPVRALSVLLDAAGAHYQGEGEPGRVQLGRRFSSTTGLTFPQENAWTVAWRQCGEPYGEQGARRLGQALAARAIYPKRPPSIGELTTKLADLLAQAESWNGESDAAEEPYRLPEPDWSKYGVPK